MIIEFLKLRFIIRRPIVWLGQDIYELTLRLVEPTRLITLVYPSGYHPRTYTGNDNDEIVELFNQCGFHFSDVRLAEALNMCIPDGVHLIEHTETGRLVSIMMSRHLPSKEFPFGGRIDWLATDQNHRGKGLGRLSAAMATKHLIERGYTNVWVTTQPYRLPAIRIFNSLGFVPTQKTLVSYDWPVIARSIDLSPNDNN